MNPNEVWTEVSVKNSDGSFIMSLLYPMFSLDSNLGLRDIVKGFMKLAEEATLGEEPPLSTVYHFHTPFQVTLCGKRNGVSTENESQVTCEGCKEILRQNREKK